jgi:uncharacterized protein (TIGR00730 family)
MKSIVVFCGSAEGISPVYKDQAFELGRTIAAEGMRLVYGGAKVGIMGALADGALQNGGEVTGVLPFFLQTKEVAHEGVTEMIITENMHERKLKMHELSDAIITLPGGWGTMEEMFEMLTWAQLGLHEKPIGILNTNGYYDHLLALCKQMVLEGFLKEELLEMLIVSDAISELLSKMHGYKPLHVPKWITQQTT